MRTGLISRSASGKSSGSKAMLALAVSALGGCVLALASTASGQCAGSWISSPISATGFADGRVIALHQWDQDGAGPNPPVLVAAGSMTLSGTAAVTRICRFDPAANGGAGAWVQLGDGLDGEVNVLTTASNGDLIAGGFFQNSGPTGTRFVARFNGTSWQPLGSGMNTTVWALAERPASAPGGANSGAGQIFAGGWFTIASGNGVNRVTRWTGTNWTTIGPNFTVGANDWLFDLQVMPNGDIIAGGPFTTINGVAASKIARWNGTVWSGLGSGLVGGEVYEIFPLANSDIIVSGTITAAGGLPVKFVARWNNATSTWSAMGDTWVGNCRGFFLSNAGDLHAINVNSFDFNRIQIVRWNGATWQPVATANSTIFASALLPNGDVAIGGSFTSVDGVPANRIAVWRPGAVNPTNIPSVSSQPGSIKICPGGATSLRVVASVTSGTLTYAWRKNGNQIFTSTNPTAASATLAFAAAQAADAGLYDCVISSPCGVTVSAVASLAVCRADINCSGAVGTQDIFDFIAFWFANDPRADINNVGGISPQDIFDFLTIWFSGC